MTNARPVEFSGLKAQQRLIRGAIDGAVARVLDHGQFVSGPEVVGLEAGLAAFCGARHVITCASGSDALTIALMAKGTGAGDAILCPDFTHAATVEAIVRTGATPVLVDVDPATFNIDPEGLAPAVRAARAARLKPKGMIAVDLFGLPANYGAIRAFAVMEGLFILADAAQSFGASYRGRKAGAIADVTATSFSPARPLGCYGDGGAVITDDGALADVVRQIRRHGRADADGDSARIGLNSRLDTLQAAIMIEKLRLFPAEIDARAAVAGRYNTALGAAVRVPLPLPDTRSVWAHYTVAFPRGERDRVAAALAASAIPTRICYPRPIHEQTSFRRSLLGYDATRSNAAEVARAVLCLPMHPYLTADEQDQIVSVVLRAIG